MDPSAYVRTSHEIARSLRQPGVQGREQRSTRALVDEYSDAMRGLTAEVVRAEHVLQVGGRGKARQRQPPR